MSIHTDPRAIPADAVDTDAAIPADAVETDAGRPPLPRPIDVATLELELAAGRALRLLDVRTAAEFEHAHIPGSYNVPLDTLGEHADELHRHLDVPVVVVCRTGARARQAEQRLAAAGMAEVHVLDGGIQAWDDGRRSVRRGRSTWALERQVRLVAGGLVLAGTVASVRAPRVRYLAGAVGLGLTVAALTDTCAMGAALSKLPYNRSRSCDVDRVVAELTGTDPATRR
ncbi:MAG: rhodanese-like domain-containing protein [Microthrixaceae bacterium]